MSKKILVICQHFWPENFRINDLCEGFFSRNIEIDVLCGEPNYPKGEWFPGYSVFRNRREIHNGIRIFRTFEIRRKNNTNLRIFLNYMCFPIASIFHLPELLKNHYDRIFIYQLSPVYMAWAGLLMGKLSRTPVVMYIMDLWPENLYSVLPFRNPLIRGILMKTSSDCYRQADKLICLTEAMRRIVQERTRKSETNLCVIPQCCEKLYEKPFPVPELMKRFPDGFRLIFTGNISPAQDYQVMTAAAKLLEEQHCRIHWIIVGDGMSCDDFKELVRKEGLEHCFSFEGFHPVEEIPGYTYLADGLIACLAKSSLLECTIPAKVMSYIASGKPLILAMDGEAQNLVNEHQCGFAGASGDAEALAENIRKLYQASEEERRQMGENARRLHFERFERDKNLDKLIDFLFSD